MNARARWWMLHGGWQCLILLVPAWLLWREHGTFAGLTGLGLVANVALANLGHATQFRLGWHAGFRDALRARIITEVVGQEHTPDFVVRGTVTGHIAPDPWEPRP